MTLFLSQLINPTKFVKVRMISIILYSQYIFLYTFYVIIRSFTKFVVSLIYYDF